ncbi:sucrose-6-phosphate hydrolase [Pontibacillus salipaludis]|uniref:glycoside hydrolase family 32 protein n=1 Tax=Pontibacillus salipaludis TaxID=1697394 RepID=UPI0031E54CC2
MSQRDNQLRQEAYAEIEKFRDQVEADPHRLRFHIQPPVGLLNDPNGFVQYNGTYHMFYQWMPFKTGHGAKFWGHYTSDDLVNWQAEPIALTPSEWFEKNGCYSGSAVEANGLMNLFYTGNVKDEEGKRESYQVLATSEDGIHFEKQGVVLELPEEYTAHFRDPKVWKHGEYWYMVVGTQNHDLQGRVALFRSSDLSDWEHMGVVTGAHTDQLDDFGFMWECPDLFELEDKHVLVVSPQGLEVQGNHYQNVYQSGYFVGDMNYETGKLEHGSFKELDQGFEFYAPQTTLDDQGRRILVGWMGVPDQDEEHHPTIKHKWIHTLTLPRELTLDGDKLIQKPIVELEKLRKEEISYERVELNGVETTIEGIEGDAFELQLGFEHNKADVFELTLRNNARVVYHKPSGELTLERKRFEDRRMESRTCKIGELEDLLLFVDTSSVEMFVNGGEEVFTARYYPEQENRSVYFASSGELTLNVSHWKL